MIAPLQTSWRQAKSYIAAERLQCGVAQAKVGPRAGAWPQAGEQPLKHFWNNVFNHLSHIGPCAAVSTVGTKIVVDGEVVHDMAKSKWPFNRPFRNTLCGVLYYCIGSPITQLSSTGKDLFVRCSVSKFWPFLAYDPIYCEHLPVGAPRVPLLQRD